MPLSPGAKLGPYEITSPLGAGGMGEVYRARDTRLGRDVAIKVLPQHLSSNPDLKARFEREAKAISALNHPHICHLYDVGSQDGTDFIVMELLEGESLAQRLQKGPLPLKQTLEYGIEVAEALEKAHKSGIVHRDLKPGNVMLTKSGAKLLDFGLAKPATLAAGASGGSAPLLSAAMTASGPSPASPLTGAGTIVGTIQYMSPEQISGQEADARSDIFSFGAVLYEMATGKRPFEGKSQLSVASAILEKDPEPVSRVRTLMPTALDYVVKGCLEKSPDERIQTVHDVRLQLKWVAESGSDAGISAPKTATITRRSGVTAAVAALVAAVIVGAILIWLRPGTPSPVIRATILPPPGAQFALLNRNGPAVLSPDGTKLAFIASRDNNLSLWVRSLDKTEATELPGTAGAFLPFWSPDGKSLGFFANRKLWRTGLNGALPIAICDAPNGRGGSWNRDDVIIFAPDIGTSIYRVQASGGAPVQLTHGENDALHSHRWPFFLPDGKHFIYLSTPTGAASPDDELRFAAMDGGKEMMLARGRYFNAQFSAGWLLGLRDGVLTAQKIDPSSGKLSGDPISVAENVQVDGLVASAIFSASDGFLLYQQGGDTGGERVVWTDAHGKEQSQVTESGFYGNIRLSPDDSRVLYPAGQSLNELWMTDLTRGTRMRVSFAGSYASSPAWAPDGRTVYFAFKEQASGAVEIYSRSADGSRPQEKFFASAKNLYPADISRDGKYLLYEEGDANSSTLKAVPLQGEKKPLLVVDRLQGYSGALAGAFNARISPDGNWLAYQSMESGQSEVYVTKFPGGGGKYQISTSGGTMPVWSRDEKRIYYLDLSQKLMSMDVTLGKDAVQIGKATPLFQTGIRASISGDGFEVARDGRFLLVNSTVTSSAPLTLVTNWQAELKK